MKLLYRIIMFWYKLHIVVILCFGLPNTETHRYKIYQVNQYNSFKNLPKSYWIIEGLTMVDVSDETFKNPFKILI